MTESVSLRLEHVEHSFGSTQALTDVSFEVRRGEVHALLGHNGSGKSTLIKAISGVLDVDQGSITVFGPNSASPRLGVVHQDLGLCQDATVLENCGINQYAVRRLGTIDWPEERRHLAPILESLGARFSLDVMVRDLSSADCATVAIARALKNNSGRTGLDLLILDEATARLRGKDAEQVLSTARAVADHGGSVLLVTHHMSEAKSAADRATILSSGEVVRTVDTATVSENDLLELVSGKSLPEQNVVSDRAGASAHAKDIIHARGLSGGRVVDVDLYAREGEILGITGAAGSGHEDIPYLLTNAMRRSYGDILTHGRKLKGNSVSHSRKQGIGLVPSERLSRGVYVNASARENLSPIPRAKHTILGLIAPKKEQLWAEEICRTFEVQLSSTEAPLSSLSGGNQQKILLSRVLADKPQVLILHEPTEGVDEATRRNLIHIVRGSADRGMCVIYVSSDIEEVVGCANRVIVFRNGRTVTDMPGGLENLDKVYVASYISNSAA